MKVLLFSGTEEGRALAQWMTDNKIDVLVKVATEYGAAVNQSDVNVSVGSCGGTEGISALIKKEGFDIVIDATHPYASNITKHVSDACKATGAEYIRVLRNESSYSGVKMVASVGEAIDYLSDKEGKIFGTTGSKEAAEYTHIPNFKERVVLRILSVKQSIDQCFELGFEGKNLICAQGPFSKDINKAMFMQSGAKYLVTKDSGSTGGFDEKYEAAKELGMEVVLIARPKDVDGLEYDEVLDLLSKRLSIPMPKRKVSLIGIGVSSETYTQAASEAVRNADLVIGAKRMLESADTEGKAVLEEYIADKIVRYLDENTKFQNIAVLFSGDIGFYSGATKLGIALDRKRFDVEYICGISSVVYFCSKIGETWQDIHLLSGHGREVNIIGNVDRYPKVFSLLQGADSVRKLCDDLERYGLGYVDITIGCDFGSDSEAIYSGRPSEIKDKEFGQLCVALIKNKDARDIVFGIPDTEFIRGDAPMTKSEIRMLSVAKLRIKEDSVIYDVGAGTGSVSIELAQSAINGKVYAIEMKEPAADLIEENKLKFRTPNVEVIRGTAPEMMFDLPVPTHAFIGGSSGNLKDIVKCLIDKNPDVRMVINAVTLETAGEIVSVIKELNLVEEEIISVSVDRTRKVGRYHLMDAQNPVYIAVVRGR